MHSSLGDPASLDLEEIKIEDRHYFLMLLTKNYKNFLTNQIAQFSKV